MTSAPIPLDELLAHRDWVRAVARAVVSDPNAADDLEQETWLAAIRTPPRHGGSLRGWLGAVVRSRARRAGRTDERRSRREAAAARGGEATSPAELAEIADLHRRVVAAVVALDEPLRGTILLRYFEGLSVEDVALRTDAPLETTRSRIKRAVALLRERLSRELGDDERPWALALAPLVAAPPSRAALVGGTVMTAKTLAAIAAGVVVVALVGWAALPRDASNQTAAAPAATPSETAPTHASPSPRKRTPAEDTAARPAAVVTPSSRAEEKPTRTAEERLADPVDLLDLEGDAPLAALGKIAEATGVPIVVTPEAAAEMEGRSAYSYSESTSGRRLLDWTTKCFLPDFVVEKDRVLVVPSNGKWDATRAVIVPPKPPPPLPVTVLGRVTDAAGVAVVGAEVVREGSDLTRAVTDVAGRYELVLRPPFGRVYARKVGRVPSPHFVVRGAPSSQTTIDLPLGGPAGSVRIRVVADGKPLYRAWTAIGPQEEVEITLPDGRKAAQPRWFDASDGDGLVLFDGVPVGEHDVSVHREGYETATSTATVAADKTTEVEVKLGAKASLRERFTKARVTGKFKDQKVGEVLKAVAELTDMRVGAPPEVWDCARPVTYDWLDAPLPDVFRELCREAGGVEIEFEDDMDVVILKAPKK